jgi:hypothetical protein
LTSPDIKTITHPEDQDNGMGEHGDVRAYNGWENKSIWSLGGMYVVKRDWDGKVPELIGFGDKVGFTVEFDHDTELATGVDIGLDNAFRSGSARPFGGNGQTFFSKQVHRLFHIPVGFTQGLFAIHHSGAGFVAQIFYHLGGNLHDIPPYVAAPPRQPMQVLFSFDYVITCSGIAELERNSDKAML